MENRRVGTRTRHSTQVFQFDDSHTLFSATTRKCENNEKKKKQNVEKKKKYNQRKKDEKTQAELGRLKALVKQLKRKNTSLKKNNAKKK